jgi:hypothetical protein
VAVSFREVMGSMCVATLSLSRRQRCDETGDPGVRYGALFDDRDELVERSAFEVHADELRPINRRGVAPPESVSIWRASVANCSATSASPATRARVARDNVLSQFKEG